MGTKEWAKHEIEIACKRENPNWDGKSFDYGCSCYASALKAFESLCDDGHSGYSFSVTMNILKKLLDGKPLTPITAEDFNGLSSISNDRESYQCPRMSSLFKRVDKDGKIGYSDVDRAYSFDVEFPDDTFTSSFDMKFLDELIPITLPYNGIDVKYRIGIQHFATKDGSEYRAIISITDPNHKVIPINKYYQFDNSLSSSFKEITKEEFELALQSRAYTIAELVRDRILHIIEEYEEVYGSDLYNDFLEKLDAKPSILNRLLSACQIFEHCDPNCRTWSYLMQLIHKHKDFENYNPIFDDLIKEIQKYLKK